MGDLRGKILIEAVNPIGDDGDLEIGHTTSAGEVISRLASGARTVAAFNALPSTVIAACDDLYGGAKPIVFHCGGDGEAKRVVESLIDDAGFEALDIGPITSCRYLEPLAVLMIRAASRAKIRDISLRLLKPGR